MQLTSPDISVGLAVSGHLSNETERKRRGSEPLEHGGTSHWAHRTVKAPPTYGFGPVTCPHSMDKGTESVGCHLLQSRYGNGKR